MIQDIMKVQGSFGVEFQNWMEFLGLLVITGWIILGKFISEPRFTHMRKGVEILSVSDHSQ